MATRSLADAGYAAATQANRDRWQVFLVRSSPAAAPSDHTWARRAFARKWPNVPATVFIVTCDDDGRRTYAPAFNEG